MKTITIHNIDKSLDVHIRRRARRDKLSLNQTIQTMLSEYSGIAKKNKCNDFDEFLGLWDDKTYKDFKGKVSSFDKINNLDWK